MVVKILDSWVFQIRSRVAEETKTSCCSWWRFQQQFLYSEMFLPGLLFTRSSCQRSDVSNKAGMRDDLKTELFSTTLDLRFKHTCSEGFTVCLTIWLSVRIIVCLGAKHRVPFNSKPVAIYYQCPVGMKNTEMLKISQPKKQSNLCLARQWHVSDFPSAKKVKK